MINAIQEIVGQKEFETLFPFVRLGRNKRTKPSSASLRFDLAMAGSRLEASLGERSGNGIMLRAGRSAFSNFLRSQGDALGWNALEFRLLPVKVRISKGLQNLAGEMAKDLGGEIQITFLKNSWSLKMNHCPECKDRTASEPVCFFMQGFISEFLYWAGNGKIFPVKEVECCADGGTNCCFQISKDFLVQ
jgi:predicted hydrocarbon binding protein